MEQMEIEVVIRNVYGKLVMYPSCDKAKAFAAIAGTKTLTRKTWETIESLGYRIKIRVKTVHDSGGSV
jgi:hypothetical protein